MRYTFEVVGIMGGPPSPTYLVTVNAEVEADAQAIAIQQARVMDGANESVQYGTFLTSPYPEAENDFTHVFCGIGNNCLEIPMDERISFDILLYDQVPRPGWFQVALERRYFEAATLRSAFDRAYARASWVVDTKLAGAAMLPGLTNHELTNYRVRAVINRGYNLPTEDREYDIRASNTRWARSIGMYLARESFRGAAQIVVHLTAQQPNTLAVPEPPAPTPVVSASPSELVYIFTDPTGILYECIDTDVWHAAEHLSGEADDLELKLHGCRPVDGSNLIFYNIKVSGDCGARIFRIYTRFNGDAGNLARRLYQEYFETEERPHPELLSSSGPGILTATPAPEPTNPMLDYEVILFRIENGEKKYKTVYPQVLGPEGPGALTAAFAKALDYMPEHMGWSVATGHLYHGVVRPTDQAYLVTLLIGRQGSTRNETHNVSLRAINKTDAHKKACDKILGPLTPDWYVINYEIQPMDLNLQPNAAKPTSLTKKRRRLSLEETAKLSWKAWKGTPK